MSTAIVSVSIVGNRFVFEVVRLTCDNIENTLLFIDSQPVPDFPGPLNQKIRAVEENNFFRQRNDHATLHGFRRVDVLFAETGQRVILAFANGSVRAAQMPAGQALIPNLVPRHLLLNAIALNQATQNGSRLVGPAAIAPLLATTGAEGAFLLCTGFYAISLVQTLRIKTASTGEIDQTKGMVANVLEGLNYVYKTPALRAIVMLAFFHCGLTMSFESVLPVLARDRLGAEGAGFSYMMMAVGGGALVAVVGVAGIRDEINRGRMFLYLGILSGLSPGILALSSSMTMALIGAAAMGATQAGFMTITHTMIQSITPDGIRGRVGAVYSVHIGGMMASANLVYGGMADFIDPPKLLFVGGIAFIVVMFLSWQQVTCRQIYTKGLIAVATAPSAD